MKTAYFCPDFKDKKFGRLHQFRPKNLSMRHSSQAIRREMCVCNVVGEMRKGEGRGYVGNTCCGEYENCCFCVNVNSEFVFMEDINQDFYVPLTKMHKLW